LFILIIQIKVIINKKTHLLKIIIIKILKINQIFLHYKKKFKTIIPIYFPLINISHPFKDPAPIHIKPHQILTMKINQKIHIILYQMAINNNSSQIPEILILIIFKIIIIILKYKMNHLVPITQPQITPINHLKIIMLLILVILYKNSIIKLLMIVVIN
jgi:hypothetical protein